MYKRSWLYILTIALIAVLAVPATMPNRAQAASIDCKGAKSGDTISLFYQWSGTEETQLNTVLKPLADACGIVFKPESTRDPGVLDTRVQAGTPPDIAFWTQAAMIRYQGKLVSMEDLGMTKANYADFFLNPLTINGKVLALPVKADIKTIIWYSPTVFKAKGYEVPKTWDDLDKLVEAMVKNGDVPWSMGFASDAATGWTGSDFIQDILLVKQGPDYVNGIISGKVPYNDKGVMEAYQIYGKWASDPKYTVGGAQGTLSTPFLDAIYKVFSDPPEAMMVKQSGFAAGAIQQKFPDLKYGTDFDFFPIPDAKGLQGGSDQMMAFKNTPAIQAFVTYLSSEEGAVNWAKSGLGISPNKLATGKYTDPALGKYGDILANAKAFTADIGDSIPGGFGKAEWTAIVNYVNGKDLQPELDAVAKAQAESLAPQSAATAAATAAK